VRRAIPFVLAFLAGAAAMALVAVIAGLWNGTSSPVILNTERVERSIEASILAQRHLASMVSCPVNIVQKAGVVFNCQATVRGRQFSVVVTETDGNGHVTYVVT
jgi:ABC-type phosphate/phosphonate transport system ATPase subunit